MRAFKLRFHDQHVRIVVGDTVAGVDVRGPDAEGCFEAARPMLDWLLAREPGVKLRALSVDLGRPRVIVSFEDPHATTSHVRPMVLRIEAAEATELLDRAAPLIARLTALAEAALARRR